MPPDHQPYKAIKVIDHYRFGELILEWARGDGPPRWTMTMDEFKAEIEKIPGVGSWEEVIEIPADAPRTIHFIQGDENLMFINLSPKHMTEASIAHGMPDDGYPIPSWYDDILSRPEDFTFLDIFRRRVADYTIAGCR